MKQIKQETGRSMVEMLGVLAVIGVLSVGGIAAYKKAMIKHEANTILNDSRMLYMEAQMRLDMSANEWQSVIHRFDSGKTFQTMRDNLENNYVKVFDVDEAVCRQMLNASDVTEVSFLKNDLTDKTECDVLNEIVILWNLLGTNTECRTTADCGANFLGYCDNGTCQTCDANTEQVNATKTGCECDTTKAVACSDESGNTWCCGEGLVCDIANKSCMQGDGACQYTFSQTSWVYKLPLEINCHYTVEGKAESNTLPGNPLYTVELNEIQGCNPDEYCFFLYKDSKGDTRIRSPQDAAIGTKGTPEDIYGVCFTREKYTNAGVDMYEGNIKEQLGCPAGQYCDLQWTDSDHSVAITANSTGDLYGECVNAEK